MKSNVTIADHPLHPVIVLLPAGAWITSLVLDVILLATGNTFWFVASAWVMLIGIVGAIIAAITGAIDYFTLPMAERPRATATSHMVLNVIITVLYIINFFAVRQAFMTSATTTGDVPVSAVSWGFILNLIAVGLLVLSGWLGGELIYRYGVAIPHTTMQNAPRYEVAGAHGTTMAGSAGGETPPPEPERPPEGEPPV